MLNDLEKQIEALSGLNYATLEKGIDYDITFSNGWTNTKMDLVINVNASAASTYVKIVANGSNTDYALKNSNLAANTAFRHGDTVGNGNYAKSVIANIVFKGKYAALNRGIGTSIQNTANLNVRPLSSRAAWDAVFGRAINGSGIDINLTSYSDGYNTQWSAYGSDTVLSTTAANLLAYYVTSITI